MSETPTDSTSRALFGHKQDYMMKLVFLNTWYSLQPAHFIQVVKYEFMKQLFEV